MSLQQNVAWFTQVCQMMLSNPQEASKLITDFRITLEALPVAKYIIDNSDDKTVQYHAVSVLEHSALRHWSALPTVQRNEIMEYLFNLMCMGTWNNKLENVLLSQVAKTYALLMKRDWLKRNDVEREQSIQRLLSLHGHVSLDTLSTVLRLLLEVFRRGSTSQLYGTSLIRQQAIHKQFQSAHLQTLLRASLQLLQQIMNGEFTPKSISLGCKLVNEIFHWDFAANRSPDEDISEAVVAIPAAWLRELQLEDLLRLLLRTYSVGRGQLHQEASPVLEDALASIRQLLHTLASTPLSSLQHTALLPLFLSEYVCPMLEVTLPALSSEQDMDQQLQELESILCLSVRLLTNYKLKSFLAYDITSVYLRTIANGTLQVAGFLQRSTADALDGWAGDILSLFIDLWRAIIDDDEVTASPSPIALYLEPLAGPIFEHVFRCLLATCLQEVQSNTELHEDIENITDRCFVEMVRDACVIGRLALAPTLSLLQNALREFSQNFTPVSLEGTYIVLLFYSHLLVVGDDNSYTSTDPITIPTAIIGVGVDVVGAVGVVVGVMSAHISGEGSPMVLAIACELLARLIRAYCIEDTSLYADEQRSVVRQLHDALVGNRVMHNNIHQAIENVCIMLSTRPSESRMVEGIHTFLKNLAISPLMQYVSCEALLQWLGQMPLDKLLCMESSGIVGLYDAAVSLAVVIESQRQSNHAYSICGALVAMALEANNDASALRRKLLVLLQCIRGVSRCKPSQLLDGATPSATTIPTAITTSLPSIATQIHQLLTTSSLGGVGDEELVIEYLTTLTDTVTHQFSNCDQANILSVANDTIAMVVKVIGACNAEYKSQLLLQLMTLAQELALVDITGNVTITPNAVIAAAVLAAASHLTPSLLNHHPLLQELYYTNCHHVLSVCPEQLPPSFSPMLASLLHGISSGSYAIARGAYVAIAAYGQSHQHATTQAYREFMHHCQQLLLEMLLCPPATRIDSSSDASNGVPFDRIDCFASTFLSVIAADSEWFLNHLLPLFLAAQPAPAQQALHQLLHALISNRGVNIREGRAKANMRLFVENVRDAVGNVYDAFDIAS